MPPASSPPPDSLRVLQWNAGGFQARSTELLHFLSSHPVDLICIQESNYNSFSSFRIPVFSALRSDRTHSRSGILSPDATHASGGVVIFVRQGLSFSELSTSSLSLLDTYSDYVGVNISLNNSSSVSFLNVHAPPYSLLPNGWQNRFLLSLNSSLLQKSFHSGGLQLPSPPLGLKRHFRPPRIKRGIERVVPASDLYAFAPATVYIPASTEMADMRAIVCVHLVQAKTFNFLDKILSLKIQNFSVLENFPGRELPA